MDTPKQTRSKFSSVPQIALKLGISECSATGFLRGCAAGAPKRWSIARRWCSSFPVGTGSAIGRVNVSRRLGKSA